MAIVINGSGTVTGISVGGLPDGIVDAGTLATNSVDSAELIDGSIDASHLATDVGVITNIQTWLLTTNLSLTGSSSFATIDANLAVSGLAGYAGIGSLMTESSGVFTFPSTGIWKIDAIYNFVTSEGYARGQISVTTNNSSYTIIARSATGTVVEGGEYATASMSAIIDVTDTANVKVIFEQGGTTDTLLGSSTLAVTSFTFTRIGDT